MQDKEKHIEEIKAERVFLHDIVNNLSISQGMIEIFLKNLDTIIDEKELARLVKSVNKIEESIAQCRARREILIKKIESLNN